MAERRKDRKGKVLKEGESQRKDGSYDFRWRTSDGKRHSVYARTLEELREKEQAIQRDKSDGIRTDAKNVTLNDIYDMWAGLKKGLKDNTFQNYQYMYNQFVYPDFGRSKVAKMKRSDVRRFYNMLADERLLKISTIDNIHTVLHQVLDLAVEDEYLRSNPSDNALKELKQSHNFDVEKRKALTVQEQNVFTSFLAHSRQYNHWNPIFTVMLGTGLRVGEVTGLRWEDLDFENGTISVNHTLVYYNHSKNGCYFSVNTPKTKAGRRIVPMLDNVREAFMQEKKYQEEKGISCQVRVDGYTNFVFVNRFGNVQHQGTLNKALRRIMRDCNQEILEKADGKKEVILLPRFSCHTLRHTFTTRLCESGINIKVIQDVLGHADISTTMNIYADVTKDLKEKEFVKIEPLFEEIVDFNTFSKSDFRAVKIKDCVAVPKSKKFLQFTLDDGTGTDRTILSGIHEYYEPEELNGKTAIAVVNLPPRKMMGIDSCGMLISAVHEEDGREGLNLLMVDDRIPAGAKLY